MTLLADIDLTTLNGRLAELQDALIGSGQDGDFQAVVKDEGRLLAWEISNQLGPREKESAEAHVFRDSVKTFVPGPVQVFEMRKRKGKGGDSGLTWLFAGPDFLVGVPDENLQPGLSASEMRKRHDEFSKQVGGEEWTRIGRRGKQIVQKWNRVVVKRATFEEFIKAKNKRVGILRATFAYAANMLGHRRIPQWISRHFSQVASNGKAVYDPSALSDRVSPSLIFGSRAIGVSTFEGKIVNSIQFRAYRVAAKVQDIIHGYSQDWMAGRRITRKAKVEE